MKRYLVFYGDCYYPCGGMQDFICDCNTIDEAIRFIEEAHKNNRPSDSFWEWVYVDVWCTEERKTVLDTNFFRKKNFQTVKLNSPH